MKYLLLCFINNQFECGVIELLRTIIPVRQNHCDIKEVRLSSGNMLEMITSTCLDAIREGYDRIFIQAATLVYSDEHYQNIQHTIECLQQNNPNVKLKVFSPQQLIDVCAEEVERNVYHESLQDKPFTETPPEEIQKRSFEFISQRLGSKYKDPDVKAVVVRVIHAVADFSIERFLSISPDAVSKAKDAIKNNCAIITDVGMVSAGLSLRFKDRTISSISQPGVLAYAEENHITRSAAGIELLTGKIEGSIIAVGNAPTALVQLISIVNSKGVRPACVIGVPVGFIGAAESKELLMNSNVPHICTKGNRGGSPIAVAIVNAIGCL